MLMPSRSADTAIAPRMRQYEHVQRRAERSPSVSLAVNRTPPQWQAPLIGSVAAFIHGSSVGIRINDYTLSAHPRVECERPLCSPPMTASAKRERRQRVNKRPSAGRLQSTVADRPLAAYHYQVLGFRVPVVRVA